MLRRMSWHKQLSVGIGGGDELQDVERLSAAAPDDGQQRSWKLLSNQFCVAMLGHRNVAAKCKARR